jgi:hypothetical protein
MIRVFGRSVRTYTLLIQGVLNGYNTEALV